MPNNDDQKKTISSQHQVSDLILGSLKPRSGKETSKWIKGLADKSITDAAEPASNQSDPTAGPTDSDQAMRSTGKPFTITLTDQLFDFFQQYEFDFNKTVAGTDFVIVIERPTFVNETVRGPFGSPETISAFRGRLSTRFFTLILRATSELIEGWVLPVEQTFGFRADDARYLPYVSIVPGIGSKSELVFKVNEESIDSKQTRLLAKQLFAALIRNAKGDAAENERFTMSGSGAASLAPRPAPAQAVANPAASDPPPRLSTSERKKLLGTGCQTLPIPTKASKQTARGTTGRPATKAAPGETDLDAALHSLKAAIKSELEILTAAGAEAFNRQDMAQVEQVYKKATRIKELQDELNQFLKQWTKTFQEARDSQ